MRILEVGGSYVDFVEMELEGSNLQIDPRVILKDKNSVLRFNVTCENRSNGTTIITITKDYSAIPSHCHLYSEEGWDVFSSFRVYDPAKESVPSFNTTTYKYLGIKGEQAPFDTVIGIIDESVKVIGEYAFYDCSDLKVCEMHDSIEEIGRSAFSKCVSLRTFKLPHNVKQIGYGAFERCCSLDTITFPHGIEGIGDYAFCGCESLKTITFPKTLKQIGYKAFNDCRSLKAVFIPPSVEKIDARAFESCRGIRVLSLPPNIDFGFCVFYDCSSYFHTTQIPGYEDGFEEQDDDSLNAHLLEQFIYEKSDHVDRSIVDFCSNQPPLHKTCLDTNVSIQSIHECIRDHGQVAASITDHNGMTPLHVLANNPHATAGSIMACFELNMDAAIVRDNEDEDEDSGDNDDGMNVMDYLWKYERLDCLVSLVQALCLHRNSAAHANSQSRKHSPTKRQRVQ